MFTGLRSLPLGSDHFEELRSLLDRVLEAAKVSYHSRVAKH
jgi:hypothetical protein